MRLTRQTTAGRQVRERGKVTTAINGRTLPEMGARFQQPKTLAQAASSIFRRASGLVRLQSQSESTLRSAVRIEPICPKI